MRQIVLDTETTGLEPEQGHRIIEIGCVELVHRCLTGNNFHQYLNPDRPIDPGAVEVHGITNEFLADKPSFSAIAADFLKYVRDSELVIHNAPFDLAFLGNELSLVGERAALLTDRCPVTDTLVLARRLHPGQRNTLDALCRRYGIDNSHRDLHGALLDAEILADVYLAMTGGQTLLSLESETGSSTDGTSVSAIRRLPERRPRLPVIPPTPQELSRHQAQLDAIEALSGGRCVWRKGSG